MSHQTFDLEWTTAMLELVELTKIEFPRQIESWPTLDQFKRIYVLYLQVFRKLEDAFDQIIHPQKRRFAWKALEACIGRMLEVKGWMVGLNENKEYFNYDDILMELHLPLDKLDITPPRFLTDDSKEMFKAREAFLIQAHSDAEVARTKVQAEKEAAAKAAADFQARKNRTEVLAPPPPLTEEECILIIQAEERGRQSRMKIKELEKQKRMQEVELEKQRSGQKPLTKDTAVGVLQRVARGFNGRLQTEALVLDELTLIHMNNFLPPDPNDPRIKLDSTLKKRKELQLINELEETDAMVETKEKIKELEAQEMREIMQERINVWLNVNRDPEFNEYPPFPKVNQGGSRDIIDPPPQLWRPEDEKKKGGDDKGKKKKPKKGKHGIRMPSEPEADGEDVPLCPNYFGRHIKRALEAYIETWHDKDDYNNHQQKYIPDILKNTLRPLVFEEVRIEVDVGSRELLVQLKKKIAADAKEAYKIALKAARKEGKEKEFKAKVKTEKLQAKKDKAAKIKAKKEAAANEPPPPPPPKDPRKKPKRKKDPTEKESVESLTRELASEGIMRVCPKRSFDEYICQDYLRGVAPDPVKDWLIDNSMAHAKRLTIEYAVLPLASELVHKNAPFVRTLLIHGGRRTGKTLLAHAACTAAGATFFDLSAKVIDGKYVGARNVARMLQIVFKLAKIMSPSMIYIDNVEQVFVTDKKKIKTFGLVDKPNRIKKALMKEVKSLYPGERVFLLGTMSNTQDLQGKRGLSKVAASFCKFFTKRIYTPYPDYGGRMLLWRGLLERHGAILTHHFNVSTLAYLSADFSIGDMEDICKTVLTPQRIRKAKRVHLKVEEVVDHFYEYNPIEPNLHNIARHFGKPPQPESIDQEANKNKNKKADPKYIKKR
ncbi:uncharacterized protein [Physcomitrium patens]|uniref:uncharacterized protein isoform X4 n=1 Tax=Physcomitrium patens TaxID=3218 RepID=UPI000D16E9F0|nr:IQ and AAA domain-containing protein 1-like isoform X4 [Physcomitrium patens]|eukprot:XP_024391547.1 IQ and AAA domain-containing protein 1-like isoform X4 [Physcomitrella patens]